MIVFGFFLDFIAPKKCYGCKSHGKHICEDCVKKLLLHDPYCYVCKNPSKNYFLHTSCKTSDSSFKDIDQIIVWTHYKQLGIKNLIKDAKYYGKYNLFDEIVGDVSKLFLENTEENNRENAIFVFPPMYFWRKWQRSYNHSEILTKKLAKILAASFSDDILKKIKPTKQQSKLSFLERKKNLTKSFTVDSLFKEEIIGKDIVVVDDVISTGSTLSEIAKVLKEAGVRKVIGLVIASD